MSYKQDYFQVKTSKEQIVGQFLMSIKNNFNIKKCNLPLASSLSKNNSSLQNIQARQKNKFQMLFSSIRNSNSKFKTIDYKKYDLQRKTQIQKRKQSQKPIILFLDGMNRPIKQIQIINLKRKYLKFYIDQPINSINGLRKQILNKNEVLSARKKLKSILLKQMQLKEMIKVKNKNKDKDDNNKNPLYFQGVEGILTLKKVNKPVIQKRSNVNNKKQSNIQQSRFGNKSFSGNQKVNFQKTTNFSMLTQRSHLRNKQRNIVLNRQTDISKNLIKSQKKLRIQINLEENQTKRSQAYIVLQYPQTKIISGFNYKKNAQIASLTKIMTFYTILCICREYSIDYRTRIVRIGEKASQMSGTSAEIFEGQKYTLQQLFYGLMLPSGNDAAMAIAKQGGMVLKQNKNKQIISSDDNVSCFIRYMNILSKIVGMKTSTFANCHGLPNPQNTSNPFELSLLISSCLKFEQFITVTGTRNYSFWIQNDQIKRQVKWQNTHKLLTRPGFLGGKTGVTVTAGPCLATIYKSKNSEIFIVIVLRAPKLSRRFKQTRWILGQTLKQLNKIKYRQDVEQILKNDKQLDSDNSSDQQIFDFTRNDSKQMIKRNEILAYEM